MTAPDDQIAQTPDRRSHERTHMLGDLRGEVMVYQPMTIRELSDYGAQVETSFPLQLDSLHDVRLELGDAAVVIKGRVVHCSICDMDREYVSYRSGIEFFQASFGVDAVIARFIEAVRAGRLAR